MRYFSYLANKLILVLSLIFGILLIKENFLMKDDVFILGTDFYFGISFAILILFVMILHLEKNIKLKVKIEKILICCASYITLYPDKNKEISLYIWIASIFIYAYLLIYSYEYKEIEQKELLPSREKLEKSLGEYLNKDVKSVLIDGEWGSGKTHFTKYFLENRKNKYIPIWIKSSLFENRRDIKKYIFEELKYILEDNCITTDSINDLMKKFELIGNNNFINFSKFIRTMEEEFNIIKIKLKEIDDKKIILVIDDLERIPCKNLRKEIISVISEIEEYFGINSLILCNFKELSKTEQTFFDKYFDIHFNLKKVEIEENITFFVQDDILKKYLINFTNSIKEIKEIILDENDILKNFLKQFENPRFIKRILISLKEILENNKSELNFGKENKLFDKKVHLIYCMLSFQLLKKCFPNEDIQESEAKITEIFQSIFVNLQNDSVIKLLDFNETIKKIQLLDLYNGIFSNDSTKIHDDMLEDLIAIGKISEAISILEKREKNDEIFFKLGECYYEIGEYSKSIESYTRSLDLKKNENAYNNRAMAYEKLGENENAILDYDSAIDIDPNDSMILNNRGELYLRLEKYEKAEIDLNSALKEDKTNILSWYNLAVTYDLQGKYSEAANYFKNIPHSYRDDLFRKIKDLLLNLTNANLTNQQKLEIFINKGVTYDQIGDRHTAYKNFKFAKIISNTLENPSNYETIINDYISKYELEGESVQWIS